MHGMDLRRYCDAHKRWEQDDDAQLAASLEALAAQRNHKGDGAIPHPRQLESPLPHTPSRG